MFLGLWPVVAAILFKLSPMPEMDISSSNSADFKGTKKRTVGLVLCVACIFFGSCAENAMSSWISSYMENALHIDKALGDILGMAAFAILLGIARISYAKFGKNIMRVLFVGMLCAFICYMIIGLSSSVVFAFIACILTGFCTAMLWPGSLIMMEENVPNVGVAAYALMAAGGDLGASIAPQLMGIVVDNVSASSFAQEMSTTLNLTAEQIGMKAGMFVTGMFPLMGVILLLFLIPYFRKNKANE